MVKRRPQTGWGRLLLALLLCTGAAMGQAYTAISAANIQDLQGNKLTTGKLCFVATNQLDTPMSFQILGGGQVVQYFNCATVTTGAIAGGFQVPNPATTTPAGVLYRITVQDASGAVILRYKVAAFSGASFNFDNYAPTAIPALPTQGGSVAGNYTFLGNVGISGTLNATTVGPHVIAIGLGNPTATTDTGLVQPQAGIAATLTKVACSTDTGTVSINIDARTVTTPNTAGTDALAAPLVCTTGRAEQSSIAAASFSAAQLFNLQVIATSGTPKQVRVYLYFTTP